MNTYFPDAREMIVRSALSDASTFIEELPVMEEIYFIPAAIAGETKCTLNGSIDLPEKDIEIFFRSHGYKVYKEDGKTVIDWDEYYSDIADRQQKINNLLAWGKRTLGAANTLALLANYDPLIDDYVNNGTTDFQTAISTESDPTLSALLDQVVNDDAETSRQVILRIVS